MQNRCIHACKNSVDAINFSGKLGTGVKWALPSLFYVLVTSMRRCIRLLWFWIQSQPLAASMTPLYGSLAVLLTAWVQPTRLHELHEPRFRANHFLDLWYSFLSTVVYTLQLGCVPSIFRYILRPVLLRPGRKTKQKIWWSGTQVIFSSTGFCALSLSTSYFWTQRGTLQPECNLIRPWPTLALTNPPPGTLYLCFSLSDLRKFVFSGVYKVGHWWFGAW